MIKSGQGICVTSWPFLEQYDSSLFLLIEIGREKERGGCREKGVREVV